MKQLFNSIYDFLAANDFPTLLEACRKLEWSQLARSAYTWLIVLPILIFLLWTKKFKILIAIASFFLFLLLLQKTMTHAGETLSLQDLLIFLSGAVALIGLNLYLFLVRE
ncbi:MAG: hypothetical protein ABSF90_26025 [Syntrophobacteraceae bacterium]